MDMPWPPPCGRHGGAAELLQRWHAGHCNSTGSMRNKPCHAEGTWVAGWPPDRAAPLTELPVDVRGHEAMALVCRRRAKQTGAVSD